MHQNPDTGTLAAHNPKTHSVTAVVAAAAITAAATAAGDSRWLRPPYFNRRYIDRFWFSCHDFATFGIPAQWFVLVLAAAPHAGDLLDFAYEGLHSCGDVCVRDMLPGVCFQCLATAADDMACRFQKGERLQGRNSKQGARGCAYQTASMHMLTLGVLTAIDCTFVHAGRTATPHAALGHSHRLMLPRLLLTADCCS